MKVEFYVEQGEWTPRHVSQGGEVQASLFELDDEQGDAEVLVWFRQARSNWRAAERRASFRAVDGD